MSHHLIQRYHHLNVANDNFKRSLDDRTGLVEDILTRVVIGSIRRYQQRLQVGIQDSVTDLLSSFKLQIVDEIYKASQNWTIATYREPILFPPECRYLYTLAGNTFVVIEQSPIVRTLQLDPRLFQASGEPINDRLCPRQLAIPYTVFVVHLRNANLDGTGKERFINLYMGWRSSPLTSLTDPLFVPYLPNIYANHTVCTGHVGFPATLPGGSGVSELTQRVLSEFWNSSFNIDSSVYWYAKKDVPQMHTVEEWEKNSKEDPLFILNVPFLSPTGITTVKGLLDAIVISTEEPTEAMDLRHQISEMADSLSEQLFQGVKNYVFNTKFDRFYPKDITDNLAEVMETCAKQVRTIALSIEIKLNDIVEEMKELQDKSYKWRKRGPLWKD